MVATLKYELYIIDLGLIILAFINFCISNIDIKMISITASSNSISTANTGDDYNKKYNS